MGDLIMQKLSFYIIIATTALVSIFASVSYSEVKAPSPHSEKGDCSICHVASVEKLNGWFVFTSTKVEMKPNLDQICRGCHTIVPEQPGSLGIGIGHATGKKLLRNIKNLPLAKDGTINCSTTCHNLHISADSDPQLIPKRLRFNSNELCMSCHKM